jgi:cytochrome b
MPAETAAGQAVTLWDLPVRVIHWSFVLLMPALWWSAESGDLTLHKQLGLVMLWLLLFRIFWGFAGSSTSRFSQFVKGPAAVFNYLRSLRQKETSPVLGHNPLGGWSVLALLCVLTTQASIGLFAQDVDGIESGPLSHFVSYDMADAARGLHHLIFNLIMLLVIIHLAAILFYSVVKRETLIRPMITGKKTFVAPIDSPMIAPRWRSAVCAIAAGLIVWWVSLGSPFHL